MTLTPARVTPWRRGGTRMIRARLMSGSEWRRRLVRPCGQRRPSCWRGGSVRRWPVARSASRLLKYLGRVRPLALGADRELRLAVEGAVSAFAVEVLVALDFLGRLELAGDL